MSSAYSERQKPWLLVALILSIFSIGQVYACDPCGMHGSVQVPGILSSLRSTGLVADSWTFSAQQQVGTFKIRGDNDLRTTEENLELIKTLAVTQTSVGYNLTDSFAMQINLPFIVRDFYRFERFRKVRDSEVGLGDLSLTSTFTPYSWTTVDSRFFVAGIAGVKLPTGDSGSLRRVASEDSSTAGDRIQGRGLTLGTGSVDVPIGVVSYIRDGRLQLFANAQYSFRGEGASSYRFGNDFIWSVSPGWLFLLGEDESLSLSLSASGESKPGDRLDGQLLTRTSANNVYLGPEIFYSLAQRTSLQFGVDLPVSLDVGGAAVKPETRTRVAISLSF